LKKFRIVLFAKNKKWFDGTMSIKNQIIVFFAGALAVSVGACRAEDAACFNQASQRYSIPVQILKAISRTESGGNPSAFHRNENGSFDIGHMQINSSWLPTLAKTGITQQQLFNPCTNTFVAAWILAGNIRRMGYEWKAIGAYNARSPDKAAAYSRKIAANMRYEKLKVE
jgi:soluble lytic murein transglycosylase-like protein